METENSNAQQPESSNTKQFLKEIVKFGLLALIIVVPVRLYIASPFIVSGSSMSPTFETGNYLIIDQLSYTFGATPERGDVIVFQYPKDPDKFFIKRVIGLPNETVRIQNGKVTIDNNDLLQPLPLNEPYIVSHSQDNLSTTLGEDEYFVLGDNRSGSSDSRSWGPLPEDLITGRAYLRLFPLTDLQVLPGAYGYPSKSTQ